MLLTSTDGPLGERGLTLGALPDLILYSETRYPNFVETLIPRHATADPR